MLVTNHQNFSLAKVYSISVCMCVFVVCSFHVSSRAQSSTAYANALSLAKDVFTAAVSSYIPVVMTLYC